MQEIWKGMKYNNIDYSKYFKISNLGNIYSNRTNKNISISKNKKYYYFITRINKKVLCFIIHRAVASTFIPNPENKPQINHKNGIKTDNRVENLEWVTAKENTQHAIENNLLKCKGENNVKAKLKESDIKYIRSNYIPYNKQFGISAFCKKFNISKQQIINILQNKYWKNI